MALFNTAYQITSEIEGGWSNDKYDSGGETWRGIARNMDKSWDGWEIIDNYKNRSDFPKCLEYDDHLQELVLRYYKAKYWDSLRLDDIFDQRIANELYDTGVNMGIMIAATFLQRTLNVLNVYRGIELYPNLTVDGKIGSKTIAAYNSLSDNDRIIIYKLLNCLQGARYIAICESNETQEKFMRGWSKRIFES